MTKPKTSTTVIPIDLSRSRPDSETTGKRSMSEQILKQYIMKLRHLLLCIAFATPLLVNAQNTSNNPLSDGFGHGYGEIAAQYGATLWTRHEVMPTLNLGLAFSMMLHPQLSAGLSVGVDKNYSIISLSGNPKTDNLSYGFKLCGLFDWHIVNRADIVPSVGISAGYTFLTKDSLNGVGQKGACLFGRAACLFHVHERVGLRLSLNGGLSDTFRGQGNEDIPFHKRLRPAAGLALSVVFK